MCFFVHHHIACLCSVIIYCKTRVMAKFRCWGLPLNIEFWKQCILTKEFWAWTMIPHCTLVFSLHISRTFVDFLLLVDKTRSKYCSDQVMLQNTKKRNIDKFLWYIFISFIKCMTSIYLFVKYFLRFPHVYYTEDSNRSGLILLSHCVSLSFCNTLGAILLINSPELT